MENVMDQNQENQNLTSIEKAAPSAIVAIPNIKTGIDYEGANPVIELSSQSFCFPFNFTIPNTNKRRKFYFFFKPYDERDIKLLLAKIPPRTREAGDEKETTYQTASEEYLALMAKCFLYVHGMRDDAGPLVDVKEQKDHLFNDAEWLAVSMARKAFGNFEVVKDVLENGEAHDPEIDETEVSISALKNLSLNVSLKVTLSDLDFERGKFTDHEIIVTHAINKPNREQMKSHDSSFKHVDKGNESRWKRDADVVCMIYDNLINDLEGVLYQGEKCTSANKKKWIGSVPAWWKIRVIDTVMNQLKNV